MIPIVLPRSKQENKTPTGGSQALQSDGGYAATLGRLAIALSCAGALTGILLGSNWGGPGQRPRLEQSAKPGINELWKSADIGPLIDRLETESREIYHEREQLAALVGLRPGMAVADVGAGSGFMVELFAREVGPAGKVYAVDINPSLLGHISRRAAQAGMKNVQAVLTREDSVDLPRNSVDVVFLCDTFHHFEFPKRSLRGIHRALRKGGELVIVEFHRVPGRTEPRMLEHVRAGQEEFTREIARAEFRLLRVEETPFLKENYVLRFRKK